MRILWAVMFLTVSLFGVDKLMYAKDDTELLSDDKKPLGTVNFASPLIFIKQNGELSKVALNGWIADGSEDVMYIKEGVILEVASINEEGAKIYKKIGEKDDEYGNKWLNISIEGWVKSSELENSVQEDMKALNTLYTQRCSACHAPHDISHFDANVWPAMMDAMADRAGISPSEKYKILRYLQFETLNNH